MQTPGERREARNGIATESPLIQHGVSALRNRTWVARRVACSAAFVTAAALAGSVLAREPPGVSVRTMTVHYGDLNISTPP